MRRKSFEAMTCSVAQCLELVGERWTPLIIRDLLFGVTRFEDLQQRLGISRNVLVDRLRDLEDHGLVTRSRYQTNPERFDYVLTDKGADLWPVVAAMREWGNRWAAPEGPPVEIEHRGCSPRVQIVPACSVCGQSVTHDELIATDGPGIGDQPMVPNPAADPSPAK